MSITEPHSAPGVTERGAAPGRVIFEGKPIRGVLFDVDGTLYRQRPLRIRMAAELALLPLRRLSIAEARSTWNALLSFRRVREELRDGDRGSASLDDLQYAAAAEAAGMDRARLESVVRSWIYERPLPHLLGCRRDGLVELLELLVQNEVRVGAFSDYPVEQKLAALGVSGSFSLKLAATDPEVNRFKPHPKGFRTACEKWGLSPGEVLYVGDRPEVDAVGATACGMPCVIVGKGGSARRSRSSGVYTAIASFHGLRNAITT